MKKPLENKIICFQHLQKHYDDRDIKNLIYFAISAYKLEPAGDVSYIFEQLADRNIISRKQVDQIDSNLRKQYNQKPLVD